MTDRITLFIYFFAFYTIPLSESFRTAPAVLMKNKPNSVSCSLLQRFLSQSSLHDNSGVSDSEDLYSQYETIYDENIGLDGLRDSDLGQKRDIDLILGERAKRFYNPKLTGISKEKCVIVAVEAKLESRRNLFNTNAFSFQESLSELSELVGTAGLQVMSTCIQRLYSPNVNSYIGPGKVFDVMAALNASEARTVVIDDDLSPKQQRNLEALFVTYGGPDVKILDRTAVILEIFAQHAQSREGQLQVELAMLEYRLTRGPKAKGGDGDSGCGFRGPGETKIETDKRAIRDKIVRVKREISLLGVQREQHRKSRSRLGLPVVALVGYTNAGKSTLLNRLSRAGVLAENMLFATLDPTTRKIVLPKKGSKKAGANGLRGSRENYVGTGLAPPSSIPTDAVMTTVRDGDDKSTVDDCSQPGEQRQRHVERLELQPQQQQQQQQQDTIDEEGDDDSACKGQEILLTDTVGFISKLPSDLIAAFRATLEEVAHADVLIHVCDRSNPVWLKQRETVMRELEAIGCHTTPIVELWNKIDALPDPEEVMLEAACVPVDVAAVVITPGHTEGDNKEGDTEDETTATTIVEEAYDSADVLSVNAYGVDIIDANDYDDSQTLERVTFDMTNSDDDNIEKPPGDQWLLAQSLLESESNSHDNYDEESEYITESAPLSRDYSLNYGEDYDGSSTAKIAAVKSFSAANRKLRRQDFFASNNPSNKVGDDNDTVVMENKSRATIEVVEEFSAPARKTFVVAASAKTGLGFDDFIATLEDALSLMLVKIDVFIPYDKDDGIVSKIHQQGIADVLDYKENAFVTIDPITWQISIHQRLNQQVIDILRYETLKQLP